MFNSLDKLFESLIRKRKRKGRCSKSKVLTEKNFEEEIADYLELQKSRPTLKRIHDEAFVISDSDGETGWGKQAENCK